MTRGIGELPIGSRLGSQGQSGSIFERRMMQDVRQQTLSIRSVQAPPAQPTNLKVTAQAFGNLLQWTRSGDADGYDVFVSTTPDSTSAQIMDVGNTATYLDHVGNSGIKHWYWVRATKRNNGLKSGIVGGLSATTLASNMGVTPPTPPAPSVTQAVDLKTGKTTPIRERQVADV